jgi:hypothetical protein
MSAYWDFRSILDVYPDEPHFICVSTQKGARCGQRMLSGSDLSRATRILDQMDANKRLSSSYKHLEELAELTLCPRWHRKAGYSQVRSVSNQWKRDIADYAAEVEMEREKAAMAKSKRALSKMKDSVVEIKIELEEEATNYKVCPPVLKFSQQLLMILTGTDCQSSGYDCENRKHPIHHHRQVRGESVFEVCHLHTESFSG